MEDSQATPLSDQQKSRISKLLSVPVEDMSRLLDQLQDGSKATDAFQQLVQYLDEKAVQEPDESWKDQAEEAKAALSTEKINFEQRLQQYESKINAFKSQLTTTKQKFMTASKEAQEAGAKAAELESKLANQQSGSLHVSVELDTLKARVETLEVEKRESLTALERKVAELDQSNEDYQSMSARYQEVKRESAQFESEAREAKASEMSIKLQKQGLEQELGLLKQRMEWATNEIAAKSTEFGNYRTEKSTQILQLQADLEQARLEATSAAQSNSTAQRRLLEQQSKSEELLVKNKELQDQIVVQEEQFRVEMETQRRLGELWERAATDNKARVADLEQSLDEMQRALSNKDSEYQENMTEVSEEKVQLQINLEKSLIQIEQLKEEQKRADELLNKAGLIDTTGSSGFDIGRIGVLSPTAAVAARIQKTGMSLTQVYARYMELQSDHLRLKNENSRLQETMEEIVKDLADGAPLIREQQEEHQRLQRHAEELAVQLEAISLEKDQIAYGAREALAQLDGVVKERDLLHKENQDLDRQVQNLLWRLKAPNAPQELAPASTLSVGTGMESDGEKVIDDHLVLFANLQEMQQQNKKLREVARQMIQAREQAEGAEAQAKKKDELEVIAEAELLIENMREEIGAKELQIATYKQELDMMRRILKTSNIKYPLAAGSVTSQSSPDQVTEANKAVSDESLEYAKLFADLQKSFDAYRAETSVDNKHLKDQLQQAQTENSESRIQLGRAKTQIAILDDRYQGVIVTNTHLSTEVDELRKQCNFLRNSSKLQEEANQKITSELYTERDAASRLNAELSSLRNDHKMTKAYEQQILEQNKSLNIEKAQVNDLLRAVQNMANEVERGNEQTKRRLETAIASKEQEVETLKDRLKEEIESGKRLRDRKDIEAKEWQTKIDTLTAEYQTSREALIAAKTSLDHTNSKVEDLTKQIKSREEQLAIYQKKPDGTDSTEASREEQLQSQVLQLKNELSRLESEADAGREHLAQFQAISQTNEDRLAEITATFEEFKKDHDQKIEESVQTIRSLESRLANADKRVEEATTNLMEMQNRVDQERLEWKKEKDELDSKLRSLRNTESKMDSIEKRHREAMLRQQEDTKQAQEKYEKEFANHAIDMTALQNLKERFAAQSSELHRHRAAAETAIANLQTAERSWESQKSTLQKTLAETEKRCAELKSQNDKLHHHLEDVSAQALSIQQRMNAPLPAVESEEGAENDTGAAKGSPEHQVAELRDVIRYVRREKDILECQYELNLQESRRLKLQLEQTNKSLEETRDLLTTERNQHQDVVVSQRQQEELLDKVNQLNILRESNSTLRTENSRLQTRVQSMENNLRNLNSQLNPMKDQLAELRTELQFSKDELQQVGEDRDRWRSRTQEIMAKHDRIDPVEFQELKDAVEKYKTEIAETEVTLLAVRKEHEELQKSNSDLTGRFSKLYTSAQMWKKRFTEESPKFDAAQKELSAAKGRISELEKSVEEVSKKASQDTEHQQKLDALQAIKDELEKENKELKANKEIQERNFEALKVKTTATIERNRKLVQRIREGEAKNTQEAAASTAPAPGTITQAEADAKLEEEKQKLKEDLEKKHADALRMVEMRNSLKLQSKEKEVQKLKDQLSVADANGTTGAKPAALNPVAAAFTPNTAGRPPVRPINPVRQMNNGRPVRPEAVAATATSTAGTATAPGIRGLPARPGRTPPAPGPGQSRLRPPLSARNAAVAAVATPTAPTAPTATPPTPAAAAPAPEAAVTTVEPVATITATPAPAAPVAATPAPVTTAPTQPTGRVVIKRRREDDLPASIAQLQTSTSSQEPKTPEDAAAKSPSAGPAAVHSAVSETRSSPLVIKRQRALPVVEASASAPVAPEARTVTIQRTRVTSVTDSSETPPASPPTNSTGATVEIAAPSAPNVQQKTAPHGQKRRLQATETVQESITLASTPGPTDTEYIEEVSTPEPSHESMAMEVDDTPPVKRLRPSSHVVVTEVTEEEPSAPAAGDLPTTPGNTTDLEEGEMEEVSTSVVPEVDESAAAEDHHDEAHESVDADVQQPQQSEDHVVEHEAEEELIQETTGGDEILEEEFVDEDNFGESEVHDVTEGEVEEEQALTEVQTPQGQEDETELDLDLDHTEESTA
ncbi:nucleoprotein TPR [Entomortierella parvispora]|uniref:Nucleoprotein TPR n=1 Tax=Entomortierella parvispora TaxID=205924 RepID=A0A9P3LVG3_9FUNG|nr:nucleoprotein TPR [Entomortierella parvispora]